MGRESYKGHNEHVRTEGFQGSGSPRRGIEIATEREISNGGEQMLTCRFFAIWLLIFLVLIGCPCCKDKQSPVEGSKSGHRPPKSINDLETEKVWEAPVHIVDEEEQKEKRKTFWEKSFRLLSSENKEDRNEGARAFQLCFRETKYEYLLTEIGYSPDASESSRTAALEKLGRRKDTINKEGVFIINEDKRWRWIDMTTPHGPR
jgi:hypothetical protein